MAYEIKGTIKRIGSTEQKSEKFSKRSLIVEVEDGKYPQTCEFQATGERCSLLEQFAVGDQVNIHWNLRGREWTGRDGVVKVFNSCDIWKIERTSAAQSKPADSAPGWNGGGNDQDKLPF
jgi:hypothetical protein